MGGGQRNDGIVSRGCTDFAHWNVGTSGNLSVPIVHTELRRFADTGHLRAHTVVQNPPHPRNPQPRTRSAVVSAAQSNTWNRIWARSSRVSRSPVASDHRGKTSLGSTSSGRR